MSLWNTGPQSDGQSWSTANSGLPVVPMDHLPGVICWYQIWLTTSQLSVQSIGLNPSALVMGGTAIWAVSPLTLVTTAPHLFSGDIYTKGKEKKNLRVSWDLSICSTAVGTSIFFGKPMAALFLVSVCPSSSTHHSEAHSVASWDEREVLGQWLFLPKHSLYLTNAYVLLTMF